HRQYKHVSESNHGNRGKGCYGDDKCVGYQTCAALAGVLRMREAFSVATVTLMEQATITHSTRASVQRWVRARHLGTHSRSTGHSASLSHTHTHTHMHTHMHTHTHTRTCLHTCIRTRIYIIYRYIEHTYTQL